MPGCIPSGRPSHYPPPGKIKFFEKSSCIISVSIVQYHLLWHDSNEAWGCCQQATTGRFSVERMSKPEDQRSPVRKLTTSHCTDWKILQELFTAKAETCETKVLHTERMKRHIGQECRSSGYRTHTEECTVTACRTSNISAKRRRLFLWQVR